MASLIPFRVPNHKQKVQSLYKRILRNLESWHYLRTTYRFKAVLMREEFEKNRNITDERAVKKLLEDAEAELAKKMHYQPKLFAQSIGNNAYGRDGYTPDWVLDYWHPLEKAQYPEYFARREERKKEYIKLWEKHYGPASPSDGHH